MVIDLTRPYIISVSAFGKKEDGVLRVMDWEKQLPFEVKRTYWFNNTTGEKQTRGDHSHKALQQVVVCLNGGLVIELEEVNGTKHKFELPDASSAIYIPPMYWRRFHVEAGSTLLSLVSTGYDESDYIRDYQEFRDLSA